MARVAEGLAVAWNTANDAVLDQGRRVLIADPARLDGVTVVGVDEHVWRHTRAGDKGEINWSSQHLEVGGVDGSASGLVAGVDGACGDAVAWSSSGAS